MNFTTDLPKRNPLVSYIVASAVRCAKLFPETVSKAGPPVYRMHAVISKVQSIPQRQLYICCHVRRVESGEEGGDSKDVQSPAILQKKQSAATPQSDM